MIAELGQFSLILACFSALLAFCSPVLLLLHAKTYMQLLVKNSIICQFLFILFSFITLTYSFAVSDFSLICVANNSHTLKPLLYKIAGSWGNHEGSMLLLVFELALINFLFLYFSNFDYDNKIAILVLQSAIVVGFLLFIIFTSNPFWRMFHMPINGKGLNPLLQDFGLALHPPSLYIGYIGVSIPFSAAIIALLQGKCTPSWGLNLKNWVLVAWGFLTLGIGLGGNWAYRELGWGGFWFWDPVENASLMPWLACTALLHSLIVTIKQNQLHKWTILLAIITFILSLLGTFLVRSGLLTSVHSFASDPERGLFVLLILGSFAFGSLTLFAVRAAKLEDKTEFNLISREGSVLINNLLLSVACFTVILGTIYPLIYTLLTNQQISVGAPYFNVTFGITMIITLFFLAISTDLKWRQSNLKIFLSTKWLANLLFAIIAACFFAQLLNNSSIITLMGIGISFFAIAAMLELLVLRIKLFKVSLNETIKLLIALPASFYAMWLAHIAVALVTFAIIMSNNLQQEKTALLAVGEKMKIAGYEIDLQHIDYGQGANYLFRRAKLYVTNLKGDEISNLYPEVRFYPVENNQTTESAIYSTWIADLYATIGDEDMVAKKIMVKIHYKPCIKLLWFSLLLIVAAAIIPAAIRQLKLT